MQDNPKSALHADRRRRELDSLGDRGDVDVLVIGGGVTGVGTALDAASRGLRTVLVDKHDLAFGTSRWSSKLAHGGLRYLASGNVGIARESAVERGILMTRTAPHLVRALPQLVPLLPSVSMFEKSLVGWDSSPATRCASPPGRRRRCCRGPAGSTPSAPRSSLRPCGATDYAVACSRTTGNSWTTPGSSSRSPAPPRRTAPPSSPASAPTTSPATRPVCATS